MARQRIRGLRDVLKELNRELGNVEGDLFDGLKAAGLFVKAEAVELAPVELGVLRNSAFSVARETRRGPRVFVGFTAAYAAFVHEMPMIHAGQPRIGARGVYWQGGENKFLEKAFKNNIPEIVRIVSDRAEI